MNRLQTKLMRNDAVVVTEQIWYCKCIVFIPRFWEGKCQF
jgi:hypothetical protein